MLIREKDKEALLRIFAEAAYPLEVWAYGSRVNGTAHSGSDLDLVIRGKSLAAIPAAMLAELNEKIRDSNMPILVELRDWTRLPDSFHRNIERRYEVLFDGLSLSNLY